ncbi:hypothetical protein [Yoonia sp. SS1-5]|uniref:Uncharacterized protein n=1 Tax=Yoonia rhodophyticola TaxID=3137370 RepID=A0AAN0NK84_9RHOB
MMKSRVLASILCVTAAALGVVVWTGPSEIRHYSADELSELTCEELGERHEDVIIAYHDAEIAHKRRTGAFHDDLGLPSEDVVPYPVLMKRFMRDNNINDADIAASSSSARLQDTDFYYRISGICAANPSWQAVDAMRQAAIELGLLDG